MESKIPPLAFFLVVLLLALRSDVAKKNLVNEFFYSFQMVTSLIFNIISTYNCFERFEFRFHVFSIKDHDSPLVSHCITENKN